MLKKQREIPTLFLKIKLFPIISKENDFLQYLFFSKSTFSIIQITIIILQLHFDNFSERALEDWEGVKKIRTIYLYVTDRPQQNDNDRLSNIKLIT